MRRRLQRALAAAGTAAVVAACGSTAAPSTLSGTSGTGGGAPAADGIPGAATPQDGLVPAAPAAAEPTGTTTAGGAAGSGTSGTNTEAATSGGDTYASTSANGSSARLGKGVDAKTVKVGIIYSPNLNDAQRATGQDNLQTGDARAQEQALLEEINRTGGLAGRKVVLDAYAISATTPDVEQAFNAACQHFVQDSKVFAVLTAGPASFSACLEKGGVLHLGSDLTAATDGATRGQPHVYRPAGITLEDSARMLVSGLNQQQWFKGAVVGFITFDRSEYQDMAKKALLPALKAIGHPAKDTYFVTTPNSVSDYGAMSSSINSAVLKFRTDGITHVVMIDQQGRITTYFTPSAEGQNYRPKYGFTSQAGFQVGVTGGSVPVAQARGAAGIGWLPAFDVPLTNPLTPGAKRCKDFFAKKGMPASGENAMVIQQFQCQDAWLLDRIMDRLTSDVTRDAFAQLLDSAGPQLTAANLSIGFDPAHHDGVRTIRNVAWAESCGCFRYSSGDRPVR